MTETAAEPQKTTRTTPNTSSEGVTGIQKRTRPLLAIIGYCMLSALALMAAREQAPGLPDWYLEAYIVGTMANVLGWEGAREYWKRRGG